MGSLYETIYGRWQSSRNDLIVVLCRNITANIDKISFFSEETIQLKRVAINNKRRWLDECSSVFSTSSSADKYVFIQTGKETAVIKCSTLKKSF